MRNFSASFTEAMLLEEGVGCEPVKEPEGVDTDDPGAGYVAADLRRVEGLAVSPVRMS